jgi:toxin ParE1/3/4
MWTIDYTKGADRDLSDIYEYISERLLAPETAAKLINRILDATDALNYMPMRHRRYDKEPFRSQGVRVMSVDNYIVLYLPNERTRVVSIIRVIYSGRNIDSQLADFANE